MGEKSPHAPVLTSRRFATRSKISQKTRSPTWNAMS